MDCLAIKQEIEIIFMVNIRENTKLSVFVYDKNFFLENPENQTIGTKI